MLSLRYIYQLLVLPFLASHVITQFAGIYKHGVAIGTLDLLLVIFYLKSSLALH